MKQKRLIWFSILLISGIFGVVSSGMANDQQQVLLPTRSFGCAAGYISGGGISYRTAISDNWFVQGTGALMKDDNYLEYNLGLMVAREITRFRAGRIYLLGGSSRRQKIDIDETDNTYHSYHSFHEEYRVFHPKYNSYLHWIGLGLGGEIFVWDNFSFSLEVTEAYEISAGTIEIVPQAAILYAW